MMTKRQSMTVISREKLPFICFNNLPYKGTLIEQVDGRANAFIIYYNGAEYVQVYLLTTENIYKNAVKQLSDESQPFAVLQTAAKTIVEFERNGIKVSKPIYYVSFMIRLNVISSPRRTRQESANLWIDGVDNSLYEMYGQN